MAQADPKTTAPTRPRERHFALGETQKYKLHNLGLVLSGLRAMAHDGTADSARDPMDVTREDMAAIFELIGDELARALADTPLVTSH